MEALFLSGYRFGLDVAATFAEAMAAGVDQAPELTPHVAVTLRALAGILRRFEESAPAIPPPPALET